MTAGNAVDVAALQAEVAALRDMVETLAARHDPQ